MPNGPSTQTLDREPSQESCLEGFAVHVGFTSTGAVVSVRGDVDARTAPTLGNLLVGIVDSGHHTVALDLAGVTFFGAGGLGVIASTGGVLRRLGGVLTLRSPPVQTRTILAITGISQRVRIEDDTPADLQADLARVAWGPTRDDVVDARLLGLVALASAAIDGADGVSVSLKRHGRIATVAASNDTVLRMDGHQYDTHEGPCVSAAIEGTDFDIASLADETRWPAFVPRAIQEGIASILSTALVDADRSVGALNIYSNTARVFGSQQRELAAVFAAHATDIVSGGDVEITDEEMDRRIGDALSSRTMLALAQGVLMARHALTPDEATAVLYRTARGFGTTTLAHAADVVSSTTDDAGDHARSDG